MCHHNTCGLSFSQPQCRSIASLFLFFFVPLGFTSSRYLFWSTPYTYCPLSFIPVLDNLTLCIFPLHHALSIDAYISSSSAKNKTKHTKYVCMVAYSFLCCCCMVFVQCTAERWQQKNIMNRDEAGQAWNSSPTGRWNLRCISGISRLKPYAACKSTRQFIYLFCGDMNSSIQVINTHPLAHTHTHTPLVSSLHQLASCLPFPQSACASLLSMLFLDRTYNRRKHHLSHKCWILKLKQNKNNNMKIKYLLYFYLLFFYQTTGQKSHNITEDMDTMTQITPWTTQLKNVTQFQIHSLTQSSLIPYPISGTICIMYIVCTALMACRLPHLCLYKNCYVFLMNLGKRKMGVRIFHCTFWIFYSVIRFLTS
ncbi:hypothetical protein VP01_2226g2 [Puccinia sorghi]|uniref:Uncharacterized protein n=1 Tax=Puccinia sorghi TaxID=27349 RepID=A0A0L6V8R1_9BASI|nr:hypothetical protein VP01_2226g2 [Puccinia sorghi]